MAETHAVEEFGVCDFEDCQATAYYLVRDRERGKQITVCGDCLGSIRGDKS